jgi:hypothetical protein
MISLLLRTHFHRSHILQVVITSLLVWGASVVHGQYFGRNKVQYDRFDFQVMKTEHFHVLYYPTESTVARDGSEILERWYDRFQNVFDSIPAPYIPVILYANHADFQQTNVVSGLISQATGGVTEGLASRMVIPWTDVGQEDDHVLGHELVHVFQYDMTKGLSGTSTGDQTPLWFIEGMAEYLSLGRQHAATAMWLRDAVIQEHVPSWAEIGRNSRYFPYRYGHAMWVYITSVYGDSIVAPLCRSVLARGVDDSFKDVLGTTVDSISRAWQQAVYDLYRPMLVDRTVPAQMTERIISEKEGLDIAPTISPDGMYVTLLSNRGIFTIDLYLADGHSGKMIRKLVSSNTDAHFDALRFMNSAGAWSPDSREFAFVVIRKGDNAVAIATVPGGDIRRVISINTVDAITDLAWAPDGKSLVFAGTHGGISNLYLYRFDTEETTQLTDDPYAEIQPCWSPDGSMIAFATDQGPETDYEKLVFGPTRIGILDLSTGQIKTIAMSNKAKHINPVFSADGESIYLIADPDGYSDIYRYEIATKEYYRVTKVATGVMGLTELSPALSISRDDRLVFNVFENTDYVVCALNRDGNSGDLIDPDTMDYTSHVFLPVFHKGSDLVADYLMPEPVDMQAIVDTSRYRPKLKAIYAGQTAVGVSAGSYGLGLAGSTQILFSDLLGEHLVLVSALISGGIKDLGAQVYYINLSRRLNWGALISHIPYLTGYMASRIDTISYQGQPLEVYALGYIQERQYADGVSLVGSYPFSTNRRLEFSAGYTRLSYEVRTDITYTTLDGYIIGQEYGGTEHPPGLNLFNTGFAYVGDYSFNGFTSPVRGRRYRFEITPYFGSLNYVTLLADYRYYYFLKPVTIAGRLLHYGRYLGDSESDYLSPLYVGNDALVRGYSVGSFDASECTQTGNTQQCPEYDRLIGTKLGVFNLELRIPVLGNEQFGLVNFPYLPVELAAFLDGGVAWTDEEKPVWKLTERSTERIPVFSAGLALRVNIANYFVAQVYYAYPFQRPGKGFLFGFSLSPGW